MKDQPITPATNNHANIPYAMTSPAIISTYKKYSIQSPSRPGIHRLSKQWNNHHEKEYGDERVLREHHV
jgi:hypothetical protein